MIVPDGLTLGAYAAAGALDAASETEWDELLAGIDGAHGVEVPFRVGGSAMDRERTAARLPADWHVVVTLLPHTVGMGRVDPDYGLASTDPRGRREAMDDACALRQEILRLHDALGRSAVIAVHLNSAPSRRRPDASSQAALTASLAELAGLDWHGAALVVEHCDAAGTGAAWHKGYLTLEEETAAVVAAGGAEAALGQSINWGRSAIEGRSAATVVQHLAATREAGTLAGVVFSGAAATDGPFGGAWHDVHNPVTDVDPMSLLDVEAIGDVFDALPVDLAHLTFLGVKVKAIPGSATPEQRIASLRATARAVVATRLLQVRGA